MWLGGFKSHPIAEALRALMRINETGAFTLRQTECPGTHIVGDILSDKS